MAHTTKTVCLRYMSGRVPLAVPVGAERFHGHPVLAAIPDGPYALVRRTA